MQNRKFNFEILGATGLVGREMIRCLESSNISIGRLSLWASERSRGEFVPFRGEEIPVWPLEKELYVKSPADFSLFATSAALSAEFAPLAGQKRSVAIDNSSHFRLDPKVPLVVPEVNLDALEKARDHGIIANPNCSTIQLVVCLKPLHEAAGLKRVVVSSYQSVSGAGSDALAELEAQIQNPEHGPRHFSKKIALNCIPQIDVFQENGMTKEEMKIILESRKILGLPDLRITATAVRVPVRVGHSESVNCEFEKDLSPDAAREALKKAGVLVWDEPLKSHFPTPQEIAGRDEVFVGRIRRDESADRALHLWIVADNLRKGAATNAVQIADQCIRRGFIRSH